MTNDKQQTAIGIVNHKIDNNTLDNIYSPLIVIIIYRKLYIIMLP